ncbi:MAG: carbohydrate ABC transporter permease, partial [Planctomycetes bacterium]|nr:carbohydrate ABC transporter permease [Planctomycetota bacterium]
MIEERHLGDVIADVIIHVILVLLSISCLLPFLNVLATSLSSVTAIQAGKVSLWPVGLHWENYLYILRDARVLVSLQVSILRVVIGVVLTLAVTAVTAYPLSQDRMHLPGRDVFKGIMLFFSLFGGGLIPTFMAYKTLGLLDNFAVLVVPGAFSIFSTIILINFFRGLPPELSESAVLDGANEFDILSKIYLPLSLPSLATLALFSAVGHWNAWFDGIVFFRLSDRWPLQSLIYVRVITKQLQWESAAGRGVEGGSGGAELIRRFQEATPEGLAAAMIAFAAIP